MDVTTAAGSRTQLRRTRMLRRISLHTFSRRTVMAATIVAVMADIQVAVITEQCSAM